MARQARTGRLFTTQVEWSVDLDDSLYRRRGARQGACGDYRYQIARAHGPMLEYLKLRPKSSFGPSGRRL
jgi:hypothetical protein